MAIKKIGGSKSMKKIIEFLQGKKTIITAIIAGVLAVLQELGIEIPLLVWQILGLLGLTFAKAGLNRLEKAVKK